MGENYRTTSPVHLPPSTEGLDGGEDADDTFSTREREEPVVAEKPTVMKNLNERS